MADATEPTTMSTEPKPAEAKYFPSAYTVLGIVARRWATTRI